ncbi:hypothetical protein NVP1054O_63 [Vibrio phage 1.054.O._10N.261.52.A1]|nr:hypothetical protein NVP1054O_63 [Vibrio phage 1.054.O._10N.261.52.A1]
MSLKQAIREVLTGNDVEVHSKMLALRKECTARGIHADEVTRLVKVVIHEDSKPAAMPEPEAPQPEPQPVTPEPPQAVQDKRAEPVPKRARQSYEPEEGMTPSGTKKTGAAGGRSIFDFIDEKKG